MAIARLDAAGMLNPSSMRLALLPALAALVVTAACATKDSSPPSPPPAPAAAPGPKPATGTLLGAPITAADVPLSTIARSPRDYKDKVVATSGTVTAVCQHMGCWMELKDDAGEAHVVLAGHKFFVPKNASGRRARVQAKVLETDDDAECTQEAAQQTGKAVAKLQLEATGVELD
jgi:hypothetical protein